MSRYLIAGLGNIGEEYRHTRHNIGFDVVEAFARKHQVEFKTERLAEKASVNIKGREIILIKPTTYMNLSGRAVKYWLDQRKIEVDRLLVILDDLALPLSRLRLKPSGTDAGHNGLKSIQEQLGTNTYPRLRFGIGNNFSRGEQSAFVLGKWGTEETPLVQLKLERSVEVIESFVFNGIDRTMTDINKMEFVV